MGKDKMSPLQLWKQKRSELQLLQAYICHYVHLIEYIDHQSRGQLRASSSSAGGLPSTARSWWVCIQPTGPRHVASGKAATDQGVSGS